MRLRTRLVSLQYWLYLIGSGAVVFGGGSDCIPNVDTIQATVQANVLGSATAVVDTAFILMANALLNPLMWPIPNQ